MGARRILGLVALLWALAPANAAELRGRGPGPEERTPSLAAKFVLDSPAGPLVNFGRVEIGAVADRPAFVRNVGVVPLTIEVQAPAAPFFLSPRPPFRLSAGEAVRLDLRFRPVAPGLATGTVPVAASVVDGPVLPSQSLRLRGLGQEPPDVEPPLGPILQVDPLSLDLGGLEPGEARTGQITLRNAGDQPLEISDLRIRGSGWSLLGSASRFTLARGASAPIAIAFQGESAGPFPGSLLLRSTDPARELFEAPLTAVVVAAPPRLVPPLTLTALAIEEPRDGIAVRLGALLRARGRVAATGTGAVLAVWRVDGLDLEVVPLTLVAGREIVIESRLPLPTDSPRFHDVELRTVPAGAGGGLPGRDVLTTGTVRYRVLPVAPPPPDLGWMAPPGSGVYLVGGESPSWVWPPLPAVVGYALFLDCVEVARVETPTWTLPPEIRSGLVPGEHTFEVRRLTDSRDRPDAQTTPPDFEAGFTLLAAPAPLQLRGAEGVVSWSGLPRAGVFALEVRDPADGHLVLRKLTFLREARLAELPLSRRGRLAVAVEGYNDRGEKVAAGGPLEMPAGGQP